MVERFEDLRCWQEARYLVKIVYEMTAKGEVSRDFGFKDQIRRAALSVMSNIAEGFGRMSRRESIRFYEISSASANEVSSISYAAKDLGYWTDQEVETLHQSIMKIRAMNRKLIKYLLSRNKT